MVEAAADPSTRSKLDKLKQQWYHSCPSRLYDLCIQSIVQNIQTTLLMPVPLSTKKPKRSTGNSKHRSSNIKQQQIPSESNEIDMNIDQLKAATTAIQFPPVSDASAATTSTISQPRFSLNNSKQPMLNQPTLMQSKKKSHKKFKSSKKSSSKNSSTKNKKEKRPKKKSKCKSASSLEAKYRLADHVGPLPAPICLSLIKAYAAYYLAQLELLERDAYFNQPVKNSQQTQQQKSPSQLHLVSYYDLLMSMVTRPDKCPLGAFEYRMCAHTTSTLEKRLLQRAANEHDTITGISSRFTDNYVRSICASTKHKHDIRFMSLRGSQRAHLTDKDIKTVCRAQRGKIVCVDVCPRALTNKSLFYLNKYAHDSLKYLRLENCCNWEQQQQQQQAAQQPHERHRHNHHRNGADLDQFVFWYNDNEEDNDDDDDGDDYQDFIQGGDWSFSEDEGDWGDDDSVDRIDYANLELFYNQHRQQMPSASSVLEAAMGTASSWPMEEYRNENDDDEDEEEDEQNFNAYLQEYVNRYEQQQQQQNQQNQQQQQTRHRHHHHHHHYHNKHSHHDSSDSHQRNHRRSKRHKKSHHNHHHHHTQHRRRGSFSNVAKCKLFKVTFADENCSRNSKQLLLDSVVALAARRRREAAAAAAAVEEEEAAMAAALVVANLSNDAAAALLQQASAEANQTNNASLRTLVEQMRIKQQQQQQQKGEADAAAAEAIAAQQQNSSSSSSIQIWLEMIRRQAQHLAEAKVFDRVSMTSSIYNEGGCIISSGGAYAQFYENNNSNAILTQPPSNAVGDTASAIIEMQNEEDGEENNNNNNHLISFTDQVDFDEAIAAADEHENNLNSSNNELVSGCVVDLAQEIDNDEDDDNSSISLPASLKAVVGGKTTSFSISPSLFSTGSSSSSSISSGSSSSSENLSIGGDDRMSVTSVNSFSSRRRCSSSSTSSSSSFSSSSTSSSDASSYYSAIRRRRQRDKARRHLRSKRTNATSAADASRSRELLLERVASLGASPINVLQAIAAKALNFKLKASKNTINNNNNSNDLASNDETSLQQQEQQQRRLYRQYKFLRSTKMTIENTKAATLGCNNEPGSAATAAITDASSSTASALANSTASTSSASGNLFSVLRFWMNKRAATTNKQASTATNNASEFVVNAGTAATSTSASVAAGTSCFNSSSAAAVNKNNPATSSRIPGRISSNGSGHLLLSNLQHLSLRNLGNAVIKPHTLNSLLGNVRTLRYLDISNCCTGHLHRVINSATAKSSSLSHHLRSNQQQQQLENVLIEPAVVGAAALIDEDYDDQLPRPPRPNVEYVGCLPAIASLSATLHTLLMSDLHVEDLQANLRHMLKLKRLVKLDVSNCKEHKPNMYRNPNLLLAKLVYHLSQLNWLDISGTNLTGSSLFKEEEEVAYIKKRLFEDLVDECNDYERVKLDRIETVKSGVAGLMFLAGRQLDFLGCFGGDSSMSARALIPAIQVASEASEKDLFKTLEVYALPSDRALFLLDALNLLFELYRDEFVEDKLLGGYLIMNIMEKHLGNARIQISGSASLFYVLKYWKEENIQFPSFYLRRLIVTVLNGMEEHIDENAMRRNCVLIMCRLNLPDDVLFVSDRLIRILLKIFEEYIEMRLKTNNDRPENFVLRTAMHLLNILACSVHGADKSLVGATAIPVAMRLIRTKTKLKEADEILEVTWSFLWNITDETPENCKIFLDDCDGMASFMECIEFKKLELTRNMMGLLGNVAEVKELRDRLCKNELIKIFRQLLFQTNDGIEIPYNSVGVLVHIMSDGELEWNRRHESLSEHERKSVIEDVETAIDKWDLKSERNINYRSFEPIFRLAEQYENPICQRWACWALANLTTVYPETYCALFEKENGRALLNKVLTYPDVNETVKRYASIVLQNVENRNRQ